MKKTPTKASKLVTKATNTPFFYKKLTLGDPKAQSSPDNF